MVDLKQTQKGCAECCDWMWPYWCTYIYECVCVTYLSFDIWYKQKPGSIFRNKMSSSTQALHHIIILINEVMLCLIQDRTPHITYPVLDQRIHSHAPVSTFYWMQERCPSATETNLWCSKEGFSSRSGRFNTVIMTLTQSRELDHCCNVYTQRWHRHTHKHMWCWNGAIMCDRNLH